MSTLMLKSKVAAAGIAAAVAAAPGAALASPGPWRARVATATANWQNPIKGSAAYRTANGSAQYQSQPAQRELQVEVQRIRSWPARASFSRLAA